MIVLSYLQADHLGVGLQGYRALPDLQPGPLRALPGLARLGQPGSAQSANESFYLAFLVALHVATALALLVYFRSDWYRIVKGFVGTLRTRRIETATAAWPG